MPHSYNFNISLNRTFRFYILFEIFKLVRFRYKITYFLNRFRYITK